MVRMMRVFNFKKLGLRAEVVLCFFAWNGERNVTDGLLDDDLGLRGIIAQTVLEISGRGTSGHGD